MSDHIKCILVIFLFYLAWSGGSQIPLTILCISELFKFLFFLSILLIAPIYYLIWVKRNTYLYFTATERVEKICSIINVNWFWNFERNTGTLECVEITVFDGRIVWSCLHNFVFVYFCLQFYVNVLVFCSICCWTDGRYIASII